MSRQASEFQYKVMSIAYRDMEAFCQSLRDEGHANVRLVPTSHGLFIERLEALALFLGGSCLLVGTK